MDNKLQDTLSKALELSALGKKSAANELYYDIAEEIAETPFALWDNKDVLLLGKAFNIMFHSDLFEEESESLACLHLAYAFCNRATQLAEVNSDEDKAYLFDALKTLVLITNIGEDGFYHSIAQLYQIRGGNSQDATQSLGLARTISPLVQFDFLLELEDRCGGFEHDEYLSDICQYIEGEHPDMSAGLIKEGKNIRILLAQYIEAKMKSGDLDF